MKWVGGKTKLLPQLRKFYPPHFDRYFEPFLGGGAVFFDVKPKKAFLNDLNPNIITAYQHIQKKPKEIIFLLRQLQAKYYMKSETKRADFYYETRKKFNNLKNESPEKTAYLIFLNKTGYNGMYRVSSEGAFNVPFGKYRSPTILDEANILAVADTLKGVALTTTSFKKAVVGAKRADFVYFDPPYYPLNDTSMFTNYHKSNFLEAEQLKLRDTFVELDKRGCLLMLSNSHTDFIQNLYDKFNKYVVFANRAINCKAEGRGKIKEYVITNYEV